MQVSSRLRVQVGFTRLDYLLASVLHTLAILVEHFRQLGERGVTIENLYARSWTTSGIRLCKKLGMKGEEFENEPGRWLFSLNILSSDSLLMQEYKHAYHNYLASQSEKG